METDRHSEALAVPEPAGQDFGFLDLRIHTLGPGVGHPMGEVRLDVGPVATEHSR